MKDPAFLFYSTDFYEGTRMMLPEERACYLDLLIYQHQNGVIPNNIKRLLLYCSGVGEEALKNVLESKFEKVKGGWENRRLSIETTKRGNYKASQSLSGKVGQYWKKARRLLNKQEYELLQRCTNREELINEIDSIDLKDEGLLIGSLKHRLSIYEDRNRDRNRDSIIDINIDSPINYKDMLLINILPEEYPDVKSEYIETAKAFHTLFRNNLIEAGASTTVIDRAKGTWIDSIRLMVEKDGYTIDDLREVFRFLRKDAFWKQNILSTSKLREQMHKLKLKMKHDNGSRGRKEATSWSELAEVIASFGD